MRHRGKTVLGLAPVQAPNARDAMGASAEALRHGSISKFLKDRFSQP